MKEYFKNLRALVGTIPILVCGASIIVENEQDEILLQLRKDNDCWGYPGGVVDINEVVEDAAIRELYEETGITAHALTLFGVFSGPEHFHVYPHGDQISIVDIVYLCKDYSGEPTPDYTESMDVRFFSIHDLPSNISPPCRPGIEKYLESRRG